MNNCKSIDAIFLTGESDKTKIRNVIIGIVVFLVLMSSLIFTVGLKNISAWASDGTTATNASTASTNVYLRTDSSQLKFSAPSTINYILDADGNFTCPDEVSFSNESVMDIQVSGYTVTSENGSKGVEDADDAKYSGQKDVYSVKVLPTHGGTTPNPYVFSTSYSVANTNEDWVISAAEKSIKLAFNDGRMPNPGRQWSDNDTKLQTVVWSVKAASSSK